MAKIKHFFKDEQVYQDCCDRGVYFKEFVKTRVEHYICSNCQAEVDKKSQFCSKCGEKFEGINDVKKTLKCQICNATFKELKDIDTLNCPRCKNMLDRYWGADLAKAFYELGKNEK